MTYNDARYRAAIRRARRVSRRYGSHMPLWRKAGLAVAAVVVLSGTVKAAAQPVINAIKPAATSTAQPSAAAAAAVAFARSRLGCPYVYGGTGPCSAGYDCSGLIMEAYLSAGVTIQRTSQQQWATLRHVTSPHRGDLVFFAGADGTAARPGHVGLVLRSTGPRSGVMIQAYDTGTNVMVSTYGLPTSLEGVTDPIGFARPVPLVATTAATSYTPASWASALLQDAGYRRTSCNLAAVTAWERAEGDWKAGHAGWHNLLNDKLPEPGSKVVTSDGVRSYRAWSAGLDATVTTLSGPDYAPVRAAFRAANNAQAVCDAIMASPWAASHYGGTLTAEC